MARLVPAKPKCRTNAEEELLLLLEHLLGDDFIIFQFKPIEDALLVAHPDNGFCIVQVISGERTFNPDEEELDGVDPEALKSLGAKVLLGLTGDVLPVAALIYLPDTDTVPADIPDVYYNGDLRRIPEAVRRVMEPTGRDLTETLTTVILSVSPQASLHYVRGEVTPAQRKWRLSNESALMSDGGEAERVGAPSEDTPDTEGVADQEEPPAPELSDDQPDEAPHVISVASAGPGIHIAQTAEPSATPARDFGPEVTPNDSLMILLRQTVESVIGGRSIYAAGVSVSVSDILSQTFLLPALLVSASLYWAPVVNSRDGKGGFHIKIQTDNNALLGYRLTHVKPATPLLLMVPVVDQIRRMLRNEEFFLDGLVIRFQKWLNENKYSTDAIGDLDIRLAMDMASAQSSEGGAA